MGYGLAHGFKSFVHVLEKSLNNGLLSTSFNDFMKVVELVVAQIMGFVKDERTFSTLIFMKQDFKTSYLSIWFSWKCLHKPFYIVAQWHCHHNLDC